MSISDLGILLIIFGFVLAVIAMALMFARSARGTGSERGAGLILIGPIPIVFGTDKQSVKGVIILAIVLILLALAVFLLFPYFLAR